MALQAGSTDDIALLDMVAACDAQANRAEADEWVRRILANHDAEVEEDLPPRTAGCYTAASGSTERAESTTGRLRASLISAAGYCGGS